MLPTILVTMSTIDRFNQGVHPNNSCDRNRLGYSATISASSKVNLHELQNYSLLLCPRPTAQHKKRSFHSSDSLAYVFMKCISKLYLDSSCMFLLVSQSVVSPTIQRMIDALVKLSIVVMTVHESNDEVYVSIYTLLHTLSYTMSSECELTKCIQHTDCFHNSVFIVYPSLNEKYIRMIKSCRPKLWCVPAYANEVYISRPGSGIHCHNVFPWSKPSGYHGFTIGSGLIIKGSRMHINRYMGSFNFYSSMISSTPFEDSCIDCYALKISSRMISTLIGTHKPVHRHTISSSSIEVLDDLNRRIQEATKAPTLF